MIYGGRQFFRPQTIKYLNALSNAGGSISYTALNIVDKLLVRPLESTGIDKSLIQLSPCAGNNLSASLTLLYSTTGSYSVLASGLLDADYSQLTGWTSNGTNKYVNTNFSSSASTVPEGIGCYLRTAQVSSTTNRCLMGGQNSDGLRVNRLSMNRGNGGSTVPGSIQGSYGDGAQNAVGTSLTEGFYHVVRSSTTTATLYKNGISIGTTSAMSARAATGVPIYVMGLNLQGTGFAVPLASGSFVSGYNIDAGLSAADALIFYQIIQNFNRALGRSV